MVRTKPIQKNNEKLRNLYNDETQYSWSFAQVNGYQDYVDKYRLHAIIQIVENYKPSTILDNGCGGAVIAREFAHRGYFVTGFDLSEEVLKQIPPMKNLKLISGDSISLPFEDSSFDCVICSEVLEHIEDNQLAIKEITRIMKKDGIAIITVPNWCSYDCLEGNFGIITKTFSMINWFLRPMGFKPIIRQGDTHIHKLFPWQWYALLESSGLRVIDNRASYIAPYVPKFKYIDAIVYSLPGIFKLKTYIDDRISTLWPFKYLGFNHIFVCKLDE